MKKAAKPSLPGRKAPSSVFFFGAFAVATVAQLLLTFDLSVTAGATLYAIGCALFVHGLHKEAASEDPLKSASPDLNISPSRRMELALWLTVFAAAVFFRLFRIDIQPGSLWIDETFAGINALEIIEGKAAPVGGVTPLNRFRPDWVQTPNLYLHYVVLLLNAFGTSHWGLKMVSVLPSIAGVITSYLFFRAITNRLIAFVSAFLLAVSQWSVTTGRWGWDQVLMSFLQVACYYCLVKGFDTRRKAYFLSGGSIMGLCLYTYVASWIALAIALGYFIFRLFLDRDRRSVRILDALLFLTPCLLVFSPLAAHYLANPQHLAVRAAEVNVLTAIGERGSYMPLVENAAKYGLMFNYRGSPDARHHLPHTAQLDFLTSILFVFGCAYYLRYWRRSHNFLLLLWFFFGLLAGFLSHPIDAPNAYRTALIIPVACLFAGTSFAFLVGGVKTFLASARVDVPAGAFAGLTVLFIAAWDNYRNYFIERPASPEVWQEENLDWGIPRMIHHLRAETPLIFLDPLLLWDSVVVNSWFLNYRQGRLFEPAYYPAHIFHLRQNAIAEAGASGILYYIAPLPVLPMVQKIFPGAEAAVFTTPFGQDLYAIIKLETSVWKRNLEVADSRELAGFAYDMARLYQKRAEAFLPSSPVHDLLKKQAAAEIAFAEKIDPSLERRKAP